jgi:hypothetical protein
MRESGTGVFSPAGMTTPLTPALALAYLRELSLDVRAAVVLDAAGRLRAGDAGLAERAAQLAESAAGGSAREGSLLLARTHDGGVIAVLAGDFALLPLLEHDLAATAAALVTAAPERPEAQDSR